jgi:DNA (cytosine-5)-methyltransferase 1
MSRKNFTHGSLFSGIGGFDLAAEWMGWENIFHCEWNAFGQKVLKHYWPNAISYENITKTDFTIHRGRIDILTGGFPCQPYSAAGKRLGKEDDRHLWPEMLRAIREIQPMYVVGENVRGLTNWNGGMVFDEVQADLEAQGYEVLPFLLPACAVNAPHRRDRIWFVAKNTNQNGWRSEQRKEESSFGQFGNIGTGDNERIQANDDKIGDASNSTSNGHDAKPKERNNKVGKNSQQSRAQRKRTSKGLSNEWNASDTANAGLERMRGETRGFTQFCDRRNENRYWQNFPTVSPVYFGDDGLSDRLDSITFPKWRNESIKAGGNAIVPQVAYQIFKALSL